MVTWTRAVISSPGVARYVFRNDTIPPFSPFDVKVGAYNNRGEGPFSSIATVYSAEEGTVAEISYAFILLVIMNYYGYDLEIVIFYVFTVLFLGRYPLTFLSESA